MASDRSRRIQGAHAKRGYYCTCGRVVFGNGAKWSHKDMHERKGDNYRYTTRDRFLERFPDWRPS